MLTQQLTSGVNVDVRAVFQEQLAVFRRIEQWIELKSATKTFVTIGQLASHLKVRKEIAIVLVEGLYSTYGLSLHNGHFSKLWIFVKNGKVPTWLQAFLSPPTIRHILIISRQHNDLDIMARAVMRLKLNAIPNFEAILKQVWEHGRDAITRALYTVELIDNTAGLDYPVGIVPQPIVGGGGGIRPSYTDATSGIQWRLDYGTVSYEQQDCLDFTKSRQIDVGEVTSGSVKRNKTIYNAQQKNAIQIKIQKLIDWMLTSEYTVSKTSHAIDGDNVTRPIITFAGKSGLGETVSVQLPFPGIRVKLV